MTSLRKIVVCALVSLVCSSAQSQNLPSPQASQTDELQPPAVQGPDDDLRRVIPTPLINDLDVWRQRLEAGERGPALGVGVRPLSPQLATHLGIDGGVFIEAVIGGSSAARAKLREGDVVVRVGDAAVKDPFQLRELVSENAGREVVLVIYRAGDRKELTVTLPTIDEADDADEAEADDDGEYDAVEGDDDRRPTNPRRGLRDRERDRESTQRLLEGLLRGELEEMSREIEEELGAENIDRVRDRLRRLLDDREFEGRRRAGRSRESADNDRPADEVMDEIRAGLEKLSDELDALKERFDDRVRQLDREESADDGGR